MNFLCISLFLQPFVFVLFFRKIYHRTLFQALNYAINITLISAVMKVKIMHILELNNGVLAEELHLPYDFVHKIHENFEPFLSLTSLIYIRLRAAS